MTPEELRGRNLFQLALASLRHPNAVFDHLKSGRFSLSVLIQAGLAAVLLNTALMQFVIETQRPMLEDTMQVFLPSPFSAAAMNVLQYLLTVVVAARLSRAFGGDGSVEDTALVVGWSNLILLIGVAIAGGVFFIIPILGAFMMLAALAAPVWVFAAMLARAHGFTHVPAVLWVSVLVYLIGTYLLVLITASIF